MNTPKIPLSKKKIYPIQFPFDIALIGGKVIGFVGLILVIIFMLISFVIGTSK